MNSEDISNIFEKLNIDKNSISQDSINNFLNMMGNSESNASSPETNGIDMETLLKMKSMMEKMGNTKDDPRSDLLRSLKPYLKESRKGKIDQYVQLMNMGKIMELFKKDE